MKRHPEYPQSKATPAIFGGAWRGIVVFAGLVGSPAWAGDPILWVGGPPLVADGVTSGQVQIWSPAIGPTAKISVSGATIVGEPSLDGGDFATVMVTPDAVTSAGEVALKVKIASEEGKGTATLRVPVVPPDAGAIGITFDPPVFRSGVDSAVSVRIRLPDGPRAPGSATVDVHSNVGVIDTVTVESGNVVVARWRPSKEVDKSQNVLFAVVDAAAPDRVMGTSTYPVIVRKSLELPAPAGASAVLTVGDRQFGPLPAGPNGRVKFDVERDPRIAKGRLRIIGADGAITESDVELAFGEAPQFTFVPPPVGVQADPTSPVKVFVVAAKPDGSPWTGTPPTVAADRGTVSSVSASSEPGRYVVIYTPPDKPGPVRLTASLEGPEASRTFQVVAPVDLSARSGAFSPVELDGAGRDTSFTVSGAAAGSVEVSGGTVRGKFGGTGSVPVRMDGGVAQMVAVAGPAVQPSGRPVARLQMWTADPSMQADSSTQTPVVVVALDDQGQPVPGVDVQLTVAAGAGSVTMGGRTGALGLVAGLYTAGNQVGPVLLQASGAGASTAVPLFLTGSGYTAEPMHGSGNPAVLAERDVWRAAVAVARAGNPFPAPQPAVAPMTGADVARLEAERKAQEKAAKKGVAPSTSASAPSSGGGDALLSLGPPPANGWSETSMRVGVHLGAVPRNHTAEAEGESSLPGGTSQFTTPGFNAPSVDVRGVKWFDAVGAEARLRYVSQKVAVPYGDDYQLGGLDVVVGGRYRGTLMPGLTWQLAGAFQAQSVSSFQLSAAGVEEAQANLNGVRIGGGVALDRGNVFASAELSETFTLTPAAFQAGVVAGYTIADSLAVQFLYDFTARNATVSGTGVSIDVSETMNGLFVGVAYVLP